MSITATDLIVFSVQCEGPCQRPDWVHAYSEDEVRRLLASEGWRGLVCPSCLADEGVPLRVIASDYIPPCETGPEPTDWGGL